MVLHGLQPVQLLRGGDNVQQATVRAALGARHRAAVRELALQLPAPSRARVWQERKHLPQLVPRQVSPHSTNYILNYFKLLDFIIIKLYRHGKGKALTQIV